jgi:hypothetical protein
MSPQDYEYPLVALDLAWMDKRWGFSIMVMKWKVFLEGYLFSTINCDCDGTFEVDRKKMDRCFHPGRVFKKEEGHCLHSDWRSACQISQKN